MKRVTDEDKALSQREAISIREAIAIRSAREAGAYNNATPQTVTEAERGDH